MRPSQRLLVLAACLVLAIAYGHRVAVARDATSADAERLVFADEFTGAALDRGRWNVVGPDFWVNEEEQAYVDSPATIQVHPATGTDGVLSLRPRAPEGFVTPTGRRASFVSGRIHTMGKFDFTYGRAVARIRMPAATGIWPAFWLLGNGRWPDTGEIDIMEYVGEPDWIGVALHGPGYSGETPLVNKYVFEPGADATQWHEYEVDWDTQRILFKVDGRLIYRVTRPMVEHYGKWRFDTPKHIILNFAVGGAYPVKTNGVRKPHQGVPRETADRIKRGEIAMEVDWVRVFQRLP